MGAANGNYEVYAIKYAVLPERQRQDNFITHDAHDASLMPLDYFVWAVIGNGQTFVIDTGFAEADAKKRGRQLIRSVTDALAQVDVDAATVDDVIVTHLHYDHIGGFEQFPAARFHLQESEMQYATGPHMCSHAMNDAFEASHVAGMVHRVFEGRVAFLDGDKEIAPGLSVHQVGGHTMGLQVVRVRTRRGWVVLASDASHFYDNMEKIAPFPIVYNVGDMIRGYATLRELGESDAHIIPGHDPQVFDRYPAPNSALDGIVVRLDADSK